MKITTFIIIQILLCSISVVGQSISYYKGDSYPISHNVVNAIGSNGQIIGNRISLIQLEYPIINSLNITASYWAHKTWTEFSIDHPDTSLFGRAGFGHGSTRIKQRRYGLGMQYDILDFYNVLKVRLMGRVEYEKSFGGRSLSNSSIVRTLEPDDIIDYFPAIASIQTHPGSQFLPTIGFGVKLNLPWRLSLNADYNWTFGHRRSQTMFLEYSFQGEPQPTAEWFSDGTMRIVMVGVSLRILGEKNNVSKTINVFR